MSTAGGEPVLVVRRRLPFPREQVFAAWLDRTSLAQWMYGKRSAGGTPRATVEVDPRVGGKFRIVMHMERDYEHRGEYLAIEPPALLSFTWISQATDLLPTLVTVEFLERGAGTELVLTHQRLPQAQVENHREGWTTILRLLEEVLAGGRPGGAGRGR